MRVYALVVWFSIEANTLQRVPRTKYLIRYYNKYVWYIVVILRCGLVSILPNTLFSLAYEKDVGFYFLPLAVRTDVRKCLYRTEYCLPDSEKPTCDIAKVQSFPGATKSFYEKMTVCVVFGNQVVFTSCIVLLYCCLCFVLSLSTCMLLSSSITIVGTWRSRKKIACAAPFI